MILKLKRTPGIYLVGFMASGKTTIGRLLAHELGWSFADSDQDIEDEQQVPIGEIFDQRGEEEFRRIENEAVRRRLREVERGKPTVLALGGGAFIDQSNQTMLREKGVTIWLDCSFPRVCGRVQGTSHRPLARDPQKLEQLYEQRRTGYANAEYRIEIDSDDPATVVAAILKLPIF
jgi:shikimate kinase